MSGIVQKNHKPSPTAKPLASPASRTAPTVTDADASRSRLQLTDFENSKFAVGSFTFDSAGCSHSVANGMEISENQWTLEEYGNVASCLLVNSLRRRETMVENARTVFGTIGWGFKSLRA